jgi:hypothetical protein
MQMKDVALCSNLAICPTDDSETSPEVQVDQASDVEYLLKSTPFW